MPFLRSLALASAASVGFAALGACSSTTPVPSRDAALPSSDADGPPFNDATSESGPGADAADPDASALPDDATVGDSAVSDGAPDATAIEDTSAPDAGLVVPDSGDDSADASLPTTYTNPVLPIDFPDPFVLRLGSTYFAFATNADAKNIQAARSTDLAEWTRLPDALPILPAWAVSNAGLTWAPSVLPRGGGFVMYYTTRDRASGFQCVSRALATSPAGPYVDSSTSAFVCQVSSDNPLCGSIDPYAFVDTDGTAYLLWKSDENASACARPPRLWSAQLAADGLSLAGPASELLIMDQPWQQPIIEAPAMTWVGGKYYLLYSANSYESAAYAMGYATCLSPTGPCENASVKGPAIASGGSALGPGGGSFFDDPQGGSWLVYHAWTAPKTTYAGGGARSLRIDRLVIGGGMLSLSGPSTSPEPL